MIVSTKKFVPNKDNMERCSEELSPQELRISTDIKSDSADN